MKSWMFNINYRFIDLEKEIIFNAVSAASSPL